MERLNRGDKIYLDAGNTKESEVNRFLECRDGFVEVYEYRDNSGYGLKTRLFLCRNTKHESEAVIRQTYSDFREEWIEESMFFDSDSFEFLKALLIGKENELGGKYSLIRNYNNE